MAKQEDFQLKESARELRLATAQLRSFNESAGVEIAKTVGNDLKKGVLDPFTQSFAQIPGVSTLGSVGKTLFNKTFAAIRQRNENERLRKQIGISKEQFKQLQAQKKVTDAQKKFGDNLATPTITPIIVAIIIPISPIIRNDPNLVKSLLVAYP